MWKAATFKALQEQGFLKDIKEQVLQCQIAKNIFKLFSGHLWKEITWLWRTVKWNFVVSFDLQRFDIDCSAYKLSFIVSNFEISVEISKMDWKAG